MFNQLRMDLYRMKKSKSVYVCFLCMLGVIFLSYVMAYLLATPNGQKTALKLGMLTLSELDMGKTYLESIDLLGMFREANMDGGMYSLIFGIAVTLLVSGDYQGGFIKNILPLHRERWTYVGSKLIASGILNFLYLTVGFAFNALVNLLFHNLVPLSDWKGTLFYLGWVWVVTMGFAALIIMLCVLSRNVTLGVLGAVLGGSGIIVTLLSGITQQFHLSGWEEYTLYFNLTYGPSAYTSAGDLRGVAVGLVFLAVYTAAAMITVMKRDV